jgi:hypothetical protein
VLRAYAFLASGAVEPLSGFVWPTPRDDELGEWVDAGTAPFEALRGYSAEDLPYWLDDELWNVELAGALARRDHVLLPERARLVGRVDSWAEPLAWEFVTACAQRVAREAAAALRDAGCAPAAEELEQAGDLVTLERAAVAAADNPPPAGTLAGYAADVCFYARDAGSGTRAAAVAAKMSALALAGDLDDPSGSERVKNERARQAAWLADRLTL